MYTQLPVVCFEVNSRLHRVYLPDTTSFNVHINKDGLLTKNNGDGWIPCQDSIMLEFTPGHYSSIIYVPRHPDREGPIMISGHVLSTTSISASIVPSSIPALSPTPIPTSSRPTNPVPKQPLSSSSHTTSHLRGAQGKGPHAASGSIGSSASSANPQVPEQPLSSSSTSHLRGAHGMGLHAASGSIGSSASSNPQVNKKRNSLYVFFNNHYIHIQKLINAQAGRYKVSPTTRMARFMASYSSNAQPHSNALRSQLLSHTNGKIQDKDVVCIWKPGVPKKSKKGEKIYTEGEIKYVMVIGIWAKSPKKKSGGFLRAEVPIPKQDDGVASKKPGPPKLGFGIAYVELIEEQCKDRLLLRFSNNEILDKKDLTVKDGAVFGVALDTQFISHTGMSFGRMGDELEVSAEVVNYIAENTASISGLDQELFHKEETERRIQREKDRAKRSEKGPEAMLVAEVSDEVKGALGANLFKTNSRKAKEALAWIRDCTKLTIPVSNGLPADMKLIGLSRDVNIETSPCGGGYLVGEMKSDSNLVGCILTGVYIKSTEASPPVLVPVARLHGSSIFNKVEALEKKIAETKGKVTGLVLLKPKSFLQCPPSFNEADETKTSKPQPKRKRKNNTGASASAKKAALCV
uniref:Uncharacterized protein n=1 Tax=Octactis speculum TaxID=3111310 RepID=A0A7S2DDB2_9STRA